MTRTILLIVALLTPLPVAAIPVTFTFSGGDVSGWYTFDTSSPGLAHIAADDYFGTGTVHNGFTFDNAISAFEVFVGPARAMANSHGQISIGIRRGTNVDSWYGVSLNDGPGRAFGLYLWSPHDTIVDSESLTDRPPRLNPTDIYGGLTLRSDHADRDEPFSSFAVRHDAAPTSARPTSVPEPSTVSLLLSGLIAAAAASKAWT